MKNRVFSGTGVAVITPFKKDKSIDFDALKSLIEKLITEGIDFLTVLGTTSEAATLTDKERLEVVGCVVKQNQGRVPLLVGIGGNCTADVVKAIEQFDTSQIDGILSVVPFYNKPNQEGIYQHFSAIAKASPVPVVLYNVPGRTAQSMQASTALRLAREFENIVAVKEASGDLELSMEIIKNRPEGFLLLSGDDLLTLPLIACGADGVISVAAHVFPKDFSDMVNMSLKGDFESARALHYKQKELMCLIFEDGNPAGVKSALAAQKRIKNELRLPLVSVNLDLDKRIKYLINNY